MLVFPNCKINIGLYVTKKREDGFHNIESIFYPVGWQDALEIIENTKPDAKPFEFRPYNAALNIPLEEQLVYKAWLAVSKIKTLPPLCVHFYKNIPSGAGLGGGSADATFTVQLLNRKFKLGLNENEILKIVSSLGSDCAFFIKNIPQLALGKGDVLEPCNIDLSPYYLLIVNPGIICNTTEAYKAIKPEGGRDSLKELVEKKQPQDWKNILVNDFEAVLFKKHPEIEALKNLCYEKGAVYASMSGSGSSVYGLFKHPPETEVFEHLRFHVQKPVLSSV